MKDLETKRKEATKRNEAYTKLNIDEKIKRAKSRRGESKKELMKLDSEKKRREHNPGPAGGRQ